MDSVRQLADTPQRAFRRNTTLEKGAAALQYMPPDKKGSKGMNWEGAYHFLRPPDDRTRGVDPVAKKHARE
jgi:hypothetical protein